MQPGLKVFKDRPVSLELQVLLVQQVLLDHRVPPVFKAVKDPLVSQVPPDRPVHKASLAPQVQQA